MRLVILKPFSEIGTYYVAHAFTYLDGFYNNGTTQWELIGTWTVRTIYIGEGNGYTEEDINWTAKAISWLNGRREKLAVKQVVFWS